MLWTIFKLVIAVWMLRTVFLFGGSTIPIVIVVSLATVALRLVIRRGSLNAAGLRHSTKTGRFNSTIAEPFAGASKNQFHRFTIGHKEQYL
ncbi:MAG TPA: hypothetical protein VJ723_15265 [Candidatus Angelobacter sp.]|nr:hypothetical protein [Candidatus Angelobacter sp.]